MTINEILALDDFGKAVDILTKDTQERDRQAYRYEYKGKRNRRPESVDNRKDKHITIYSETEFEIDDNGEEAPKKIGTNPVEVAKIRTNAPKRIVRIAAAFLFGGEMNISFSENNDGSQLFKEIFDDKLKMKSVFNQLARIVKIETKGAILFYPRPNIDDEGKDILEIKAKTLSLKNGDFFPHFDEYGDMDAFTRTYKAIWRGDGQEHDFMWVQTAEKELLYIDVSGVWQLVEGYPLSNLAQKITVVYAEQDEPEWEDVVSPLDAYENRISRMVDTNNYFGDPVLKMFGESSLPSKDTVGKQITYPMKIDENGKEFHGDAEYLVWQQSIDSIKLETETMKGEVYEGSSTPDLSFENMRSIGSLSGAAIELMFMEAFVKAAEGMEIFGPVVQRSVSVVSALMSNVTNIQHKEVLKKSKPKITFSSILPDNLKEIVEVLTKANGDKPINSQETIVAHSPFTKDTRVEMERLKAEADEDDNRNQMTGLSIV
jgi:hypothetical protein